MTASIHPTALVDPKATLAPGVRIGPFSVIGPEVVMAADVEIGNHVTLEGLVILGAGVKVGHGAVLGGLPQDLKFRDGTPSGVRIGAGTVIREHVTIHRATTPDGWTDIGRHCLLMATSHVAHDCRLADDVIVINCAGIGGHCVIGERATVGGLTGWCRSPASGPTPISAPAASSRPTFPPSCSPTGCRRPCAASTSSASAAPGCPRRSAARSRTLTFCSIEAG